MYFPKSQITPNLYTNGGEFVYSSSKKPYTGYYFKTSTGKYYTGRTTSDKPNEELIQLTPSVTQTISNDASSAITIVDPIYDIILNTTSNNPTVYIPIFNPEIPTQQDYQNGEFRRYFCKKTNDLIYIEINKDTYDKLIIKDPQIAYDLYLPFNIIWKLTGDKQQVANINRNIVDLTIKRLRLLKFNMYLKEDYTKYYK